MADEFDFAIEDLDLSDDPTAVIVDEESAGLDVDFGDLELDLSEDEDAQIIGDADTSSLTGLVKSGESPTAGANAYNQGRAGDSTSKPKNLTDMTLGQLKAFQSLPKGHKNRIFAAGWPQFIPGTLKEVTRGLGLSDDTKFTEETQDEMFKWLVNNKKGRQGLSDYVKGVNEGTEEDLTEAMKDLAKEFASMPYPVDGQGKHRKIKAGESYYSGDNAGNAANKNITLEQIRSVLEQTRQQNLGQTPVEPAVAEQPDTTTPGELPGFLAVGGETPTAPVPEQQEPVSQDIPVAQPPAPVQPAGRPQLPADVIAEQPLDEAGEPVKPPVFGPDNPVFSQQTIEQATREMGRVGETPSLFSPEALKEAEERGVELPKNLAEFDPETPLTIDEIEIPADMQDDIDLLKADVRRDIALGKANPFSEAMRGEKPFFEGGLVGQFERDLVARTQGWIEGYSLFVKKREADKLKRVEELQDRILKFNRMTPEEKKLVPRYEKEMLALHMVGHEERTKIQVKKAEELNAHAAVASEIAARANNYLDESVAAKELNEAHEWLTGDDFWKRATESPGKTLNAILTTTAGNSANLVLMATPVVQWGTPLLHILDQGGQYKMQVEEQFRENGLEVDADILTDDGIPFAVASGLLGYVGDRILLKGLKGVKTPKKLTDAQLKVLNKGLKKSAMVVGGGVLGTAIEIGEELTQEELQHISTMSTIAKMRDRARRKNPENTEVLDTYNQMIVDTANQMNWDSRRKTAIITLFSAGTTNVALRGPSAAKGVVEQVRGEHLTEEQQVEKIINKAKKRAEKGIKENHKKLKQPTKKEKPGKKAGKDSFETFDQPEFSLDSQEAVWLSTADLGHKRNKIPAGFVDTGRKKNEDGFVKYEFIPSNETLKQKDPEALKKRLESELFEVNSQIHYNNVEAKIESGKASEEEKRMVEVRDKAEAELAEVDAILEEQEANIDADALTKEEEAAEQEGAQDITPTDEHIPGAIEGPEGDIEQLGVEDLVLDDDQGAEIAEDSPSLGRELDLTEKEEEGTLTEEESIELDEIRLEHKKRALAEKNKSPEEKKADRTQKLLDKKRKQLEETEDEEERQDLEVEIESLESTIESLTKKDEEEEADALGVGKDEDVEEDVDEETDEKSVEDLTDEELIQEVDNEIEEADVSGQETTSPLADLPKNVSEEEGDSKADKDTFHKARKMSNLIRALSKKEFKTKKGKKSDNTPEAKANNRRIKELKRSLQTMIAKFSDNYATKNQDQIAKLYGDNLLSEAEIEVIRGAKDFKSKPKEAEKSKETLEKLALANRPVSFVEQKAFDEAEEITITEEENLRQQSQDIEVRLAGLEEEAAPLKEELTELQNEREQLSSSTPTAAGKQMIALEDQKIAINQKISEESPVIRALFTEQVKLTKKLREEKGSDNVDNNAVEVIQESLAEIEEQLLLELETDEKASKLVKKLNEIRAKERSILEKRSGGVLRTSDITPEKRKRLDVVENRIKGLLNEESAGTSKSTQGEIVRVGLLGEIFNEIDSEKNKKTAIAEKLASQQGVKGKTVTYKVNKKGRVVQLKKEGTPEERFSITQGKFVPVDKEKEKSQKKKTREFESKPVRDIQDNIKALEDALKKSKNKERSDEIKSRIGIQKVMLRIRRSQNRLGVLKKGVLKGEATQTQVFQEMNLLADTIEDLKKIRDESKVVQQAKKAKVFIEKALDFFVKNEINSKGEKRPVNQILSEMDRQRSEIEEEISLTLQDIENLKVKSTDISGFMEQFNKSFATVARSIMKRKTTPDDVRKKIGRGLDAIKQIQVDLKNQAKVLTQQEIDELTREDFDIPRKLRETDRKKTRFELENDLLQKYESFHRFLADYASKNNIDSAPLNRFSEELSSLKIPKGDAIGRAVGLDVDARVDALEILNSKLEHLTGLLVRDEPISGIGNVAEDRLQAEIRQPNLYSDDNVQLVWMANKVRNALINGEFDGRPVRKARAEELLDMIEETMKQQDAYQNKIKKGSKAKKEAEDNVEKTKAEYKKQLNKGMHIPGMAEEQAIIDRLTAEGTKDRNIDERRRTQNAIKFRKERQRKIRLGIDPNIQIPTDQIVELETLNEDASVLEAEFQKAKDELILQDQNAAATMKSSQIMQSPGGLRDNLASLLAEKRRTKDAKQRAALDKEISAIKSRLKTVTEQGPRTSLSAQELTRSERAKKVAALAKLEAKAKAKRTAIGRLYKDIDDRFSDVKKDYDDETNYKVQKAMGYKNPARNKGGRQGFNSQAGFINIGAIFDGENFRAIAHMMKRRLVPGGRQKELRKFLGNEFDRILGVASVNNIKNQKLIFDIVKTFNEKEREILTFMKEKTFHVPKGPNFDGSHIQAEWDRLSREDPKRLELIAKAAKRLAVRDKEMITIIKENAPKHLTAEQVENYVTHYWGEQKGGTKEEQIQESVKLLTEDMSLHNRTFKTYEEGIRKGKTPTFTDYAQILDMHNQISLQIALNNATIQLLSGKNDTETQFILPTSETTKRMGWKTFSEMGIKMDALKDMSIDPTAEILASAMFKDKRRGALWNAAEIISNISKKSKLVVSLFHPMALVETAFGTQGIRRGVRRALNPEIAKVIVKSMKNDNYNPFEDNWELAKDFVRYGGQIGSIQDVHTERFDQFLGALEKGVAFVNPTLGKATFGAARKVNKAWDAVLWDYLHNHLKLDGFQVIRDKLSKKIDPKNTAEQEIVNREAAKIVNDTFGGQNWKALMANPRTLQIWQFALLSPDWGLSTTKQALAPFRAYSATGTTEGKNYRMKMGARFWALTALKYWLPMQALNAGMRILADSDEWEEEVGTLQNRLAKLELELSENNYYKNFFNLSAAEEAKRDTEGKIEKLKAQITKMNAKKPSWTNPSDYISRTMLDNSPGHKTELFWGRAKDKDGNWREIYYGLGKQHTDALELVVRLKEPNGIVINEPFEAFLEKVPGKIHPIWQDLSFVLTATLRGDGKGMDIGSAIKQFRGKWAYGDRDLEEARKKSTEEFVGTLGMKMMGKQLPFVTNVGHKLILTPMDMAFSQRKGTSQGKQAKAVEALFQDFAEMEGKNAPKKLRKVLEEHRRAAARNDINFDAVVRSGYNLVKQEIRKNLNDWKADLEELNELEESGTKLSTRQLIQRRLLTNNVSDGSYYYNAILSAREIMDEVRARGDSVF
jgi:hypothetical protein